MQAVDIDAYLARYPEVVIPSAHVLLALFRPIGHEFDDHEERTATVQVYRDGRQLAATEFEKAKTLYRGRRVDMAHLVERANQEYRERDGLIARRFSDPTARVRAVAVHLHKPLIETSRLILWSAYGEWELQTDGEAERVYRPTAFAVLRFAEHAVLLYYHGEFGASADDPEFEDTVRAWGEAVLAQNGLPPQ